MAETRPWSGCETKAPFWSQLPSILAVDLEEEFEARAAKLEYSDGYSRGFAEACAYSHFFVYRKRELSPFLDAIEIRRQELIVWICEKHLARMGKARISLEG